MLWTYLFIATSSITAVSAATPYRPGVAPSPLPHQAFAARIHINADTACQIADDLKQPRHMQLAAWVECQILAFYPYPRTETADDTDWLPGYKAAIHPSGRFSWNNTRYNYDGFLKIYKGFSSAIGLSYGTGWQQWRDYYVASPDTWDPKGRGGVVTTQGFAGGILRNHTEAINYPNAGYFVVKEIHGRRWIWELREHGTSPSATTLPREGQYWACDPTYEACSLEREREEL